MSAPPFCTFGGTVWRIVPASKAAAPLAPASAPEGRFHHDGQRALYASLSAEGAAVAIARYLAPGDPPRMIVPLHLQASRLADLRDQAAARIVWQDLRAEGAATPTWALADAARTMGAQGLLYRSRSRPDLIHVALFDWAGLLRRDGPPRPWP